MNLNHPRRRGQFVVWGVIGTLIVLVLTALSCGAAPTPQVVEREVPAAARLQQQMQGVVQTVVVEKEVVVEKPVETVVVEKAGEKAVRATPYPAPPRMPGAVAETAGGAPATAGKTVSGVERKIIKDAQLDLLVQDTDTAIDRITGVAVEFDGFILDSRTWFQDDYKYATLVLRVPVQFFEQALQRLRAIALKVENETVSGQDVTDQYVDLQSRLRNLEATETRIRSFLDKASDVEEALQVNQELSKIEEQIESIKGKLTFLAERAAMSTITIDLRPDVPTPTVTPTVTATPTPTATPVAAWSPGDTYREASGFLTVVVLRRLTDATIWTSVVCLPFLIPLTLIALALRAIGVRPRPLSRGGSSSSGGQDEA